MWSIHQESEETRSRRTLGDWFGSAAEWDDAVLPDYWGGSVANLTSSILQAFDVEPIEGSNLLPRIDDDRLPPDLLAGARVIIALVVDGLSYSNLCRQIEAGEAPGLASAHHQSTLTSVFPSTTAAALTSIQTGVAPGTHGMAGYTLYLRETSQVQNMITWKPLRDKQRPHSRTPATEGFLPVAPIFSRFRNSDIDTAVVSKAEFSDSALTQLHARGIRFRGYDTLSELGYRLYRELERPGRRFVSGYWGGLDTIGHSYGIHSSVANLEFRLIDQTIRSGLLKPLADLDEDVAVIILADHGHVPLPQESRVYLDALGINRGHMSHRPTGEPRSTGLALRKPDSDRDTLKAGIGDAGIVLDVESAIKTGLYGPGPDHRNLNSRIGNTLALGRGETAFRYGDYNSGVVGGHGSLSAEEMIVPLLVWRFGK